jgi:hypothetical protein
MTTVSAQHRQVSSIITAIHHILTMPGSGARHWASTRHEPAEPHDESFGVVGELQTSTCRQPSSMAINGRAADSTLHCSTVPFQPGSLTSVYSSFFERTSSWVFLMPFSLLQTAFARARLAGDPACARKRKEQGGWEPQVPEKKIDAPEAQIHKNACNDRRNTRLGGLIEECRAAPIPAPLPPSPMPVPACRPACSGWAVRAGESELSDAATRLPARTICACCGGEGTTGPREPKRRRTRCFWW